MTVTEATNPLIASDPDWTIQNAEDPAVTGATDPLGGSNAYHGLETATTGWHRYTATDVCNHATGPTIYRVWLKSVGGRDLYLSDAGDAVNLRVIIDDVTGATINLGAGCTGGMVASAAGGWFQLSLYCSSMTYFLTVNPSVGTSYSYAGDITKGINMYGFERVQHRCSALSDQSGHGYHLAQSTAGSQPFVQKANGSSPGGNLWANRAAIWQPNDVAKTAVCTTAGILTAMTVDHTFVADVYITAAATADVPLFATAGGVAIVYGIDTSRRPYVTCGTTLTGTALAVGRHRLAFVRSGNIWSIYADGVIDGSATELTPGGAISPTSVTLTQRCMGYIKGGLAGTAMSASQIATEHASMLLEAA